MVLCSGALGRMEGDSRSAKAAPGRWKADSQPHLGRKTCKAHTSNRALSKPMVSVQV